jgi:hypothetical protein
MRASARILRSWLPIVWVLLFLGTPIPGPAPRVAADLDGDTQFHYSDLTTDDIWPVDVWFAIRAGCVIDDRTVDPPDDASQTAPPVCALTPDPALYPPAPLATQLSVHTDAPPESSRVLVSLGPRPPPLTL